MNCTYYLFLLLCAFFCRDYNFSNAKAIIGEEIRISTETQFPFIVSISKNKRRIFPEHHLCTGTLVSRKHVVTCAHCKSSEDIKIFCVMAGSIDLRLNKKYRLQKWVTYLQWLLKSTKRMESTVTDISVITLKKSIADEQFEPAIISSSEVQSFYGTSVVIAGWSWTLNNTLNHNMVYGLLKILKLNDCQRRLEKILKRKYEMFESIMCSAASPYILLNFGASGGPLLDTNNMLLGINQGRIPKSEPIQKSVNVHISIFYYKQFILESMQRP